MELLFLEAKPIPSHAITALLAVIIGGIQLASAKEQGNISSSATCGLADDVCLDLLVLYLGDQLWGAFSPIHLLSAGWFSPLYRSVLCARWQH